MESTDDVDSIDVFQIHAGDGDGADLIFGFNGKQISVSVFPSPSHRNAEQTSIQDHLIYLLDRTASEGIDANEFEELTDQVLEIILDAGRLLFRASAPRQADLTTLQDLHSVLYPQTLYYDFSDDNGKTMIVPIAPTDAYTEPLGEDCYDSEEEDELGVTKNLPCYSTKSILIQEILVQGRGRVVCQALVDGRDALCKALGNTGGLNATSVGREIQCLQKLQEPSHHYQQDALFRIPQLLGYVRHSDTNRVVGFLRQWIDGSSLRDIDIKSIPVQHKKKWLEQIRASVYSLHAHDIIWGDGKASNVIIDSAGDAWLIDFGGGWTDGWVDEEFADTVEGDEQALRKIWEFLELDE